MIIYVFLSLWDIFCFFKIIFKLNQGEDSLSKVIKNHMFKFLYLFAGVAVSTFSKKLSKLFV
jgi:hypothetical protein